MLEERIEDFLQGSERGPNVPHALRAEIGRVLATLYEGEPAPPTPLGGPALEMIVVADGARPIFFLQDGKLVKGAGNGPFVKLLEDNAAALEQAAVSVGRIESDIRLAPAWTDRWFAGTAFRVGPDLVMTNRHVMEQLVNEPGSSTGPFTLNGPYWINFAAEFESPVRRRFKIKQVVLAGQAFIGKALDLKKLDLAVLRLGEPEDHASLPPPFALTTAPASVGEPVYATGYPGMPKVAGGATPGADSELEEVIIQLFDRRFGGKRCASGEVDALAGTYAEDTQRWALKHDVSTLNGNSGSPLLSLTGSQPRIVGLHFGGVSRVTNYAHSFETLAPRLQAEGIEVV